MKILTQEEEKEHYNATLRGGITGGVLGLAGGIGGITLLSRRFPAVSGLTLPLKAFLATSTGTFFSIIQADRASRKYEEKRQQDVFGYVDSSAQRLKEQRGNQSTSQSAVTWARENKYGIIFGAWVLSMGTAFAMVSRQRYLTTAQKIVQARVYAQGLTLAVMIGTAVIEGGDALKGQGRWETVMVLDPNDPEHKHMIEKRIHHEEYAGQDLWRDMIEAEEKRMTEKHQPVHTGQAIRAKRAAEKEAAERKAE